MLRILKKPLTIILILFILIGGGGIIGYRIISADFDMRSYEIISYNNLYSLRVPSDWEKSSGASKNAVIAAETPSASMYAMMSADHSYDEGLTLEEYIDAYIAKIGESSDNALVQTVTVQPEQMTMGENTGYYFEIDTSSGGVPVHMWNFMFTANGGYVHIDVVSSGQDNASQAETAKNIISSAKVLKNQTQ